MAWLPNSGKEKTRVDVALSTNTFISKIKQLWDQKAKKGDVQEKEATREVEIETSGQAGRKRKKQRLRGIADNLSHQVLQAHQATQGAGVMREEDPEVMKGVKEANVQEAVVQKEGSGQLTKMEMLNNLSQEINRKMILTVE